MYYPTYRMRRLRRTETLRRMLRETNLAPDDFIYPLFVTHGENVRNPISSMPGCYQLSIGNLLPEIREVREKFPVRPSDPPGSGTAGGGAALGRFRSGR